MSHTNVGLFATCLVDLIRPNVGFATIKLLEQVGCQVEVPLKQTCCGQPAYNNGDLQTSQKLAKQVIMLFEDYDYVVAPSGSCMGMLKQHYPELFTENDSDWKIKAERFAEKCYELTTFLTEVKPLTVKASFPHTITYHDSCSSQRELGIKQQPRQLLEQVSGLELREMAETEVCCGFGGTFSVKYPDISTRMVSNKAENVQNTEAEYLVTADMGCLMNIAGRLHRLESPVKAYHIAEILADMAEE
ncbi:(Fe-S)-binding protein [Candidatus Albibeggiatoa sp. nov. NOAA]|uniref:(Fe-S)-binding protein n=1 Tax=Candidatus Albibeggiatoa sp. nov. NOAA TaxID=3162724 RepID=UPI0032F70473|nr:(Fe-S)-binding protein [Thiotrichaceae bacterium]